MLGFRMMGLLNGFSKAPGEQALVWSAPKSDIQSCKVETGISFS